MNKFVIIMIIIINFQLSLDLIRYYNCLTVTSMKQKVIKVKEKNNKKKRRRRRKESYRETQGTPKGRNKREISPSDINISGKKKSVLKYLADKELDVYIPFNHFLVCLYIYFIHLSQQYFECKNIKNGFQ